MKKFKVGDRVRVVDCRDCEGGHESTGTFSMNGEAPTSSYYCVYLDRAECRGVRHCHAKKIEKVSEAVKTCKKPGRPRRVKEDVAEKFFSLPEERKQDMRSIMIIRKVEKIQELTRGILKELQF